MRRCSSGMMTAWLTFTLGVGLTDVWTTCNPQPPLPSPIVMEPVLPSSVIPSLVQPCVATPSVPKEIQEEIRREVIEWDFENCATGHIMAYEEYHTDLMDAAGNGDIPKMKVLMAAGADVNASPRYGETVLIYAVQRGNLEAVKLLLENGANIHQMGHQSMDALNWAATGKNTVITEYLLSKGANPFHQDSVGRTALMRAVRWGNIEQIHCLIRWGANVNARDKKGRTPIMYSMDAKVQQLLLDLGADPNLKDIQGYCYQTYNEVFQSWKNRPPDPIQ
ncbi:MAG: ankyrin repeat domain-containing protein [Blastocatellia bacterium]|nr:ankyrin repeat domain-containing protein [Blastocatellia bacterium]